MPVTVVAVIEPLDARLPTETAPAVKLPEASRLTIAEAVFASVAAFARLAPDATFAAETPPTDEIVAATDPVPLADTSPVRAEMPDAAGVVQDKVPAPSVVRT